MRLRIRVRAYYPTLGCFALHKGQNGFALTMKWQWNVLRSLHWLLMGIGGHVPPLLGALRFSFARQ